MVTPFLGLFSKRPTVLLNALVSFAEYVPSADTVQQQLHELAKRSTEHPSQRQKIVGGVLIPILVLLSGLFAGLTLGYMSLDETQLHVLSVSGTPEQRRYAEKIIPIRRNGHLLLVTLLLANMIANETLPVIMDPVLGGGFQSVVVSTALIVIFAEIIPQSVCTRYGLYVGATMAPLMWVLLFIFGIVAWPVAKLLEFILGPHHGIIYRRAELKELVALHASENLHGGDLHQDTANIIGATLDLQEKTASQAMTPISNVFMLHIDAHLDYDTLRTICAKGHSRIPVFDYVSIPVPGGGSDQKNIEPARRILGVLLVKQCVLLDPADAVPVRSLPLNRLPAVAQNEPLLGILDRFQQGHSHMAIVSRLSLDTAASVKKTVKRNLGQRIRDRVGIHDSSSSSSDDSSDDEDGSGDGRSSRRRKFRFGRSSPRQKDVEMGTGTVESTSNHEDHSNTVTTNDKTKEPTSPPPPTSTKLPALFARPNVVEASMPADAVLTKDSVHKFLEGFDPYLAPLGIITLEDVLEELIGEEIYDEFDEAGAGAGHGRIAYDGSTHAQQPLRRQGSVPDLAAPVPTSALSLRKTFTAPLGLTSFLSSRSRSAPGSPRPNTTPIPVPTLPTTTTDEKHGDTDTKDDPSAPPTTEPPPDTTPGVKPKDNNTTSDVPEPTRPTVEARIRAAGLGAGSQPPTKRRFKSVGGSSVVVPVRAKPPATTAAAAEDVGTVADKKEG